MKKAINLLFLFLLIAKTFGQNDIQGFPFSFYTGIKAEYFTLGGDFNGEDYFFTDAATIFVPEIEPGFTFGFQSGLTFKNGSLDFGYQISRSNFSHVNGSYGSMLIHNIKLLGLTFYLNQAEKFRPYIASDISLPSMNIKNGASGIDAYTGQTGKSHFSGVILGFGAGAEWKVAKKLSVRFEALPEWFKLTNVKGITKDYWEVKKFSSFKMNISTGLYLYLF